MKLSLLFLTVTALLLSSCATTDLSLSESAEQDYLKGQSLFEDEQYSRATQFLGKFIAKYPYSNYLIPAELLRIKAAYQNHEYILSETLASRFVDAHPTHPKRDYAEYTLGMSYFKQSESAQHEQIFSQKAKNTFVALNLRNPDNSFFQDVEKNIQTLTNRIAKHEMIIGKFYYERALYVGAINRLTMVKNKFPMSDIVAESLYWLAASYLALQQETYAQEIIQQLQTNYAGNEWQKKAENLI